MRKALRMCCCRWRLRTECLGLGLGLGLGPSHHRPHEGLLCGWSGGWSKSSGGGCLEREQGQQHDWNEGL
jgi:hypothetical protein